MKDIMNFWERNKQIIITVVVALVTSILTIVFTPIVTNYFSKDPKVQLGIPHYYLNGSSSGFYQLSDNDTITILTLVETKQEDIENNHRYHILPLPFELFTDEIKFIDHLSYIVFATPQGNLYNYHPGDHSANPRFVAKEDSTMMRVESLVGENISMTISSRNLSKYSILVENEKLSTNGQIDEIVFYVGVFQDKNKSRGYIIKNKIFVTDSVFAKDFTNPAFRYIFSKDLDKASYVLMSKINKRSILNVNETSEYVVFHDYINTFYDYPSEKSYNYSYGFVLFLILLLPLTAFVIWKSGKKATCLLKRYQKNDIPIVQKKTIKKRIIKFLLLRAIIIIALVVLILYFLRIAYMTYALEVVQ